MVCLQNTYVMVVATQKCLDTLAGGGGGGGGRIALQCIKL